MPLSANTLIHFTRDKASLRKILEENFRVFNCKETLILGGMSSAMYVPMVSFCDIPLSEVKDHISKYGHYGIGMTKEWGVRKGLNPVLYVAQTSALSLSYRTAWNHFIQPDSDESDNLTSEQKCLADVLRYMKNYEATLVRKSGTTPDYRFSDEREWRYVPSHEAECQMLMSSNFYEADDNAASANKQLEALRLEFEPNDIKYIIINDDSEIAEFIDHLRRAKGKNYSLHDIERLTTRILTTEQILGDM
ncbi:abortive infection system antitoxin AbiGi family protein [Paucibacter sp. XJ19-41]|uniref:abortive infection system antitoxin AbiGi family protein n=1 Tax=Paucibacter sp. XJ19-41 TaxID=2927824 RepID=UPI00234B3A6B|nr:abortive infection system antitoxin AbiGi family protein [Paucibacter sp. XJ19-41]MDC6169450.1 abortive infection system antitoxin AbiGi family protein [Paucibacter sp. XJ19-41]